MEKWHALFPNWGISTLLALIVSLHLLSSFYGLTTLINLGRLVLIPLLLLIYFYKEKVMANVFLTILLLTFMGTVFSVFDSPSLFLKFKESSYLGVCVLLIFVLIGQLRDLKFDGVVASYLALVVLVGVFLMYVVIASIQHRFEDNVIFTLTMGRMLALPILGLLAFVVYLSRESAQSILFLSVVCCILFSEVLHFITALYLDYWVFAAFQRIFEATALLLFIMFAYNHQQRPKGFAGRNIPANLSVNPMTIRF